MRIGRPTMALLVSGLVLLGIGVVALTSTTSTAGASTAAAALPVGSSVHTVTVGSTDRSFRVYRPASLPASAPLVVMIHGGGGTAAGAEQRYGWDAQADAGGFVVAYPDGLDNGWSVGGGCCRGDRGTVADDVAFITDMVQAISGSVPVDPARVYATGISEGGMLSYRLACDTTLFAAIGPDSATLLGDCAAPHPLSVIHIHGTADTRIPYDGSAGSGVNEIDGPPIPDLNATWRAIDGCAEPTVTTADPVTTSSAACADGRGVELITIAGAGHQWPGSECNRKCQGGTADPPSTALDATSTIWQFFAAHPG